MSFSGVSVFRRPPDTRRVLAGLAIAGASLWALGRLTRTIAHYLFPLVIPGETNTALLASARSKTACISSAKDLEDIHEYDYIVVGTGTAGCVLASRLSEDPNVTVLAIESGHSDLKQLFSRMPAGCGRLYKTAVDYDIRTEPQLGCASRRMQWPRGKMLGGCSSINAMVYTRGAPDDFNEWDKLGNEGWAFNDIEPFFKKAENFRADPGHSLSPEDLNQHGRSGPWNIGYPLTFSTPSAPVFLDACESVGISKVGDLNTEKGINGASKFQVFIDEKGQRSSTAAAYLTADVVQRPNLKISVGQTVTRLLFDNSGPTPRAIGVEMASSAVNPVRYLAKSKREIIISAGAVHTPQILKLSGIGPAEELRNCGLDIIKVLPAVGSHLADHLACSLTFKSTEGSSIQYLTNPIAGLPALIEWLRHGTGVMSSNVIDAGAFCRTRDRDDTPAGLIEKDLSSGPTSADLEVIAGSLAFIDHAQVFPPKDNYGVLFYIMLRPMSRGTVNLTSNDPFTPPAVDANYLSEQHDVDFMLHGLKLTRKIAQSKAYSQQFREWYYPSKDLDTMNDDELIKLIRESSETLYHPMCSARMGPNPADSVVDAQLRVHGVDGLRVADASIFPTPLACHPCAAVVMVGEKAADMIRRSHFK